MANLKPERVKRLVEDISEDVATSAYEGGGGSSLCLWIIDDPEGLEEDVLHFEDMTFKIDDNICSFEKIKENIPIHSIFPALYRTEVNATLYNVKCPVDLDSSVRHTLKVNIINSGHYVGTTRFQFAVPCMNRYDYFYVETKNFDFYDNFGTEQTFDNLMIPGTIFIACDSYNPK